MKFFSIIIPTYNRAHLIKENIQSVLNQIFTDYEIIVIDDGSTDNTADVIQSFSSDKIRYFKIPNSERGYARNYGAEKSDAEWLIFFDSDDYMYSHYLKDAYKIICENQNIEIFHTEFDFKINSRKILHRTNTKKIIFGNPFSCNNIVVRKSLFEKFKFIEDRTIAGLEDWELWLRISAHTEIMHFPVITSAIIQHDERSVMQIDKERWIKKVETFIQYVIKNPDIMKKYGNQIHLFYCGAYSYLALHLSFDPKNRKNARHYYFKALTFYPCFFFSKRSLAILKRLILHV
ncbi:MAG: glycosyltransferase family A protein [Thermoplasmata archaeon]